MTDDQIKVIKSLLFKDLEHNEIVNFMNEINSSIVDGTFREEKMEELFRDLPAEVKSENIIEVEKGFEELRKISFQVEENKIKNDSSLREIDKIEQLISLYSKYDFEQSQDLEMEKRRQLEQDQTLLNELESKMRQMNEIRIEDYAWDPDLTQEQIESIYAEGIVPGDPEYDGFVRQFVVPIADKIRNLDEKIAEKENEVNQLLENHAKENEHSLKSDIAVAETVGKMRAEIAELTKERDHLIGRQIAATPKPRIKWDPDLTLEQKEELEAEGIVPGDPEYEAALANYGVIPIEKQIANLKAKVQREEKELENIVNGINPTVSINELQEIKESYQHIKENVIKQLEHQMAVETDEINYTEEMQKKTEYKINLLVEHHPETNNLKKWENSDKLIQELKEDIKKSLYPEKKKEEEPLAPVIKNEGPNEKLWLKGMAGAAGFVSGIGLNMAVGAVPVLGAGLAVYSGARMLYNTGKFVNNIVTKINNGQEPKLITEIKKAVPEPVKELAEKVFGRPNNPYAKWFVNGVSLGYLADQVFDIHEKIGQAFTKPTNTVVGNNSAFETTNVTSTPEPMTAPVTPDITTLSPGTTVDLSGLEYGFVGPGEQAVPLLQAASKGATFDKAVLDGAGKVWYHFKQANGLGYAWFTQEQIEGAFSIGADIVSKGM